MGIDNCLEFLKIAEFGEKFSLCEASVRSTLLEFIVRIQHQEDKCEVFVLNRYLFKVFQNFQRSELSVLLSAEVIKKYRLIITVNLPDY